MLTLLNIDASDYDILRLNISTDNCPGVIWIMGAYVTAVWKARGIGHLSEAELFGFLKFKFRSSKLGTAEQIRIISRLLDNK